LKFVELDLEPVIQAQLAAVNFTECTPVQETVIPSLLEGKDVSALAQTGTGKTAAFLLPMMDRILKSLRGDQHKEFASEEEREKVEKRLFKDWKKGHFVLILVPTRELAEQVYQDFQRFKGESGLDAASVYGGTEYEEQRKKLQAGVQFVIGTPGRLIDLYKTHSLDLRQVRAAVFDEADRMFDMGFKDDMTFILQRVPKDRQILLFSATMNFDVLHTAYRFGSEPVEFNLSKDQVKAENVEDSMFHVGHLDKPRYLLSLIKRDNPQQLIIFSNFKANVERIARFLSKNGVPAMGISSLLTQAQRNRVIQQFKDGTGQNILVATDVAARGLDIKNVDMVVNYELPDDAENYVHRIGRTGRAGASGKAFSFVSDRDVDALMRIEEYLGHKIKVGWMEDTDLVTGFVELPAANDGFEKPKWNRESSGGQRPQGQGQRRPHDNRQNDNRSRGPRHAQGERPPRDQNQASRPPRPSHAGGGSEHRRPHSNANGNPNQRNGQGQSRDFKKHQKPKNTQPNQKNPQTKPAEFKRRPLKKPSNSLVGKVSKFFKNLFS
jgi:ATP-dependent RNA helicase RhlB